MNSIENAIEKLNVQEDDVIIVRGKFHMDEIRNLTNSFLHLKKNNMIICLAGETTFETMGEADLQLMLEKTIEKRTNEKDSSVKIN